MREDSFNILVVDDEKDYCDVMKMILESHGYRTDAAVGGEEALKKLKEMPYDLVMSDLMMPKMDGAELMEKIKAEYPETEVIIMSAYGTIEKAVETMKNGAYTFITKGDSPEIFIKEIDRLRSNKKEGGDKNGFESEFDFMIDSRNEGYKKVLSFAEKAARANANILILGESGAGKEIIARYIHHCSMRKNNIFLDMNCNAISDTVLESELFGHEKGSFTGASNRRIGRFEAAAGGTIFLDEIGDINSSMQAKLLKTLENKVVSRIGSNELISVDFRLITATNRDLIQFIKEGKFREDLYYRLSTIVITVPPLRNRKEDIPQFIEFFAARIGKELRLEDVQFSDSVMQKLCAYDYPGNVRELRNIIERLLVFSENGFVSDDVLEFINMNNNLKDISDESGGEQNIFSDSTKTLRTIRKETEKNYIISVLENNNHDMGKTAEILGITRRQLLNKMSEFEIQKK